MAAGGILGVAGIAPPPVEPAILASVILLGAATALALRPPLALSLAAVAACGLAHGVAHGLEAPATGVLGHGTGVLVGTAALHGLGIVLARSLGRAGAATRLIGGGASLGGLALALL